MNPNNDTTTWESYEEVAAYLIKQYRHEFGLDDVEGKQHVTGLKTGINWEIDAKGIKEGKQGFVIIECRRYKNSRQNQEKLGGLAYRILDTGAKGGIIVSPLGIQEGATKIADKENIISVRLDANSTNTQYVMAFLKNIMVGLHANLGLSGTCSAEVKVKCQNCGEYFVRVEENERICPGCINVSKS